MPDTREVLDAVFELSAALTLDASDTLIVDAYLGVLAKLFPRRLFAVRLFSEQGALSSVHATGDLREEEHKATLSREASKRHAVDAKAARRTKLLIVARYVPLFEDGVAGFDVPLLDGHELMGVLSVEYPAGVKPAGEDRELLVQLALHGSGMLRNARQYRRAAAARDPRLEERIIQTEKLATLGQLVAGVVHELNNPLTSITFYSDYLLKKKQGRADDDDVEKLKRIAASAERILKFTRDLVTYARPSMETKVALDLEAIVAQSLGFCAHLIEASGTRVEKHFVRPAPEVFGVKAQLVQVLVNLITNACHAMTHGSGTLNIQTLVRDGRMVLRVTDSGRGIPLEDRTRIFEPFFTTKGEGQGTGLGLSIVRNIVQLHRGEIDVVSEVGGGTTFEVSLPASPPG